MLIGFLPSRSLYLDFADLVDAHSAVDDLPNPRDDLDPFLRIFALGQQLPDDVARSRGDGDNDFIDRLLAGDPGDLLSIPYDGDAVDQPAQFQWVVVDECHRHIAVLAVLEHFSRNHLSSVAGAHDQRAVVVPDPLLDGLMADPENEPHPGEQDEVEQPFNENDRPRVA